MTPFYLITGFLGSGKTSFLLNLFHNLPEGEKIAVIQNEFAPNGIDGFELKYAAPGIHLIEINNGSVFCACLLGDFIETIHSVIGKYQPDRIFLEASGLADPGSLSQVMNDVRLNDKIILSGSVCLVDALNFQKALSRMPRVLQQIRVADLILVNKTDLVDPDQLDQIMVRVKQLNPLAEIISTTFGQIGDFFWKRVPDKTETLKHSYLFFPDENRPNLQSAVMRTAKTLSSLNLNKFLDELSAISIRAKGFIKLSNGETILFQLVFGTYTSTAYPDYPGNTEFTAIGTTISPRILHDLYTKYLV